MYAAQSHIYDPPAVSINMASDQHIYTFTPLQIVGRPTDHSILQLGFASTYAFG